MSKKDKFIIEEVAKDLLVHTRHGSKAWEMLTTVLNTAGDDWSNGKSNRWIGYAQCLLVAEGAITLDECMRQTRAVVSAADEIEE